MTDEVERWRQRFERERAARREAEALLTDKSRELHLVNEALRTRLSELTGAMEILLAAQDVVAAASSQMKGNVTQVASSSVELEYSVREIAKNASESALTARRARAAAEGASRDVETLASSAKAINQVTKLIRGIADQTKLLALNATIEAARAGDLGKGFGVVASEVKTLARETAQATDEIATQVESIQEATERSVASIGAFVNVTKHIDNFASLIAASVEEQTMAVREIAQNASEAARAVSHVVESIRGVSTATEEAAKSVELTRQAATSVEQLVNLG